MKKFFVLGLLVSINICAMDSICAPDSDSDHDMDNTCAMDSGDFQGNSLVHAKLAQIEKAELAQEPLHNTPQEYESMPFKLWHWAEKKGIINKAKGIYQVSRNKMHTISQSKPAKSATNITKKTVAFLQKYGLYDKVMPSVAGVLGYALGEYVLPITCVDLPGIRPSCIVSTTPIGGGICFPFSTLVCDNIKYLSALGVTMVVYLLTKSKAQTKEQKSE